MIYTYWGNKNEQDDGTSVLKIASGEIPIGQAGDFTDAEYLFLSQLFVLKAGDIFWPRDDFSWMQEVAIPSAPTNIQVTPADQAVILDWAEPYSDGGSRILGYVITSYIDGIVQEVIESDSGIPNYIFIGLQNGTAYTFKIAAINRAGISLDSVASALVMPSVISSGSLGIIPAFSVLEIGDGLTVWSGTSVTRNQDVAISVAAGD